MTIVQDHRGLWPGRRSAAPRGHHSHGHPGGPVSDQTGGRFCSVRSLCSGPPTWPCGAVFSQNIPRGSSRNSKAVVSIGPKHWSPVCVLVHSCCAFYFPCAYTALGSKGLRGRGGGSDSCGVVGGEEGEDKLSFVF